MVAGGGGRRDREFGMDMYTLLYLKWITNQGPTLWNMGLCHTCGRLDRRGVWGRMDTRIRMAESLHRSLETITTLLISHTQIQNKVLKK